MECRPTAIPYSRTRALPKNNPCQRINDTTPTYIGFADSDINRSRPDGALERLAREYRGSETRSARRNPRGRGGLRQSTTPRESETKKFRQAVVQHATGKSAKRRNPQRFPSNDQEYCGAENSEYSPHRRKSYNAR